MKLDYETVSQQLEQWAGVSSSSEIHGLVAGLATVGLAKDFSQLQAAVARHVNEPECPEHARQGLLNIQEVVLDQLQGTDFDFETLLPEDDEELYVRVEALGQWCQGYLVGFGTGVKATEMQFSTEAQEVLRDMVEVSKVSKEHLEESEEDEVALTELQEYVRTAVMLLYSEFALPQNKQGAETPETFH